MENDDDNDEEEAREKLITYFYSIFHIVLAHFYLSENCSSASQRSVIDVLLIKIKKKIKIS